MLGPGTVVDGRYEIVSRLGSGGMAEVYCAQDTQLGRPVALKLLHPHFAEDQEFVERFRREASSAAALSHPNVVSVFDRGEWNDTYYIAMEYIEGRSLKAIVGDYGALDPASAVDLVLQILRAARFAHRRGVIHRDLKPHNVLVDEENRAKVTDFGIARAGASDMTETGSIIGTVQYLSPEQAQGRAVSASSDLYAIGIILFELLTGRVPFDGDSAVSIALQQVTADPPVPSSINPAVPAALDTVVLRALAKDPEARYADADAFIAALEEVRAAGHVDLSQTASFEPAAVLASGGIAHAVAPPIASPPQVYGPPPPAFPDEEPGDPSGYRRLWLALLAVLLVVGLAVGLAIALHKQKIAVPRVVGLQQFQAVQAIQGAGLRQSSQVVVHSEPDGQVIAENPSGGTNVNKGSTVTITVSSGPGSHAVPDVTGLTIPKATQKLRNVGFTVQTTPMTSATVQVGHVIGTSPPASSPATIGQPVTLEVSSGPPSLSVVSVVGDMLAGARSLLETQGLKVQVVRQSSTQPPGTVLAQSPASGSVTTGSTVILTVAQATPTVAVPTVVGLGPFRAGQVLKHAGLTETVVTQPTSVRSQDHRVISSSPAVGARVKTGSAVQVTVGQYQPPTQTTTGTTGTTTTGTTTGTTTSATPPTPPAAP